MILISQIDKMHFHTILNAQQEKQVHFSTICA